LRRISEKISEANAEVCSSEKKGGEEGRVRGIDLTTKDSWESNSQLKENLGNKKRELTCVKKQNSSGNKTQSAASKRGGEIKIKKSQDNFSIGGL